MDEKITKSLFDYKCKSTTFGLSIKKCKTLNTYHKDFQVLQKSIARQFLLQQLLQPLLGYNHLHIVHFPVCFYKHLNQPVILISLYIKS